MSILSPVVPFSRAFAGRALWIFPPIVHLICFRLRLAWKFPFPVQHQACLHQEVLVNIVQSGYKKKHLGTTEIGGYPPLGNPVLFLFIPLDIWPVDDGPSPFCAQTLSRIQLLATLWPGARQAPLSMGFSRQEYWGGLPCPPPGDLPDPELKPRSPALQTDSLPSEPHCRIIIIFFYCSGFCHTLKWNSHGFTCVIVGLIICNSSNLVFFQPMNRLTQHMIFMAILCPHSIRIILNVMRHTVLS